MVENRKEGRSFLGASRGRRIQDSQNEKKGLVHGDEARFGGLLCAGAEEVVQVYGFCIHTLHLTVVSVMIIKVMWLSYNKRVLSDGGIWDHQLVEFSLPYLPPPPSLKIHSVKERSFTQTQFQFSEFRKP